MAVIRDIIPAFELYQPTSVDDALKLLDRYGTDALVLAGGLDSMDWLKDRLKRPRVVVDLGQIALGGLPETGPGVRRHLIRRRGARDNRGDSGLGSKPSDRDVEHTERSFLGKGGQPNRGDRGGEHVGAGSACRVASRSVQRHRARPGLRPYRGQPRHSQRSGRVADPVRPRGGPAVGSGRSRKLLEPESIHDQLSRPAAPMHLTRS